MVSTPKSNQCRRKAKPRKAGYNLIGVSKKPKRCLFTYNQEDLMKAIEDINNKTMGFREACRFYGVPFATVHDRLSGKVAAKKKPRVGPDPILGVQGEEKLRKWILEMAKCGFPLSKQDLLENVSKIIAKAGIKTPFKNGKPGDTWYQKFLKRHPEISIREPEGINNARAAITETRIRSWFKELHAYVESINALDIFEDPDRIFNGDETGFSLCPKSGKVLGPKGYKNLYLIKRNNEKENITVLIVFAANGKLCPPLVIFPYVRPPKALVDNMPQSWVLGRSDSGWMKSDIFYEYISNDFNCWLTKNEIKKPIILFIDGHKSHMTFALSEFCQANGIILYALPPNSTHMLQPADVSVFRPLKQNWKNTVKQWQSENLNQILTKLNFCSILEKTLSATKLEDAIRNGFRKCGLYPLNENNVDYTKCVKDTQEKLESERRKPPSSNNKLTATSKEFDAAIKIISMLKFDLAKRNMDSKIIEEEIVKAKVQYLQNRRSKSKTPRNSAASNKSASILTDDILLDITPENLNFNEPETNVPLNQNINITTLATSKVIADTLLVTDETIVENITFPEPGTYISLNDISVMDLNEIEISQPISQLTSDDQYGITVSTPENVLTNSQIPHNLSFDDVFEKHLLYPESPTLKTQKRVGPKLPSAISSQAWREHYRKREEVKENLEIEKKRKQQLRTKEKEKKLKEKEKRIIRKKSLARSSKKKVVLQCSQCSEDLISDVEDDLDKNIGCDYCTRWFHLKCTVMHKKPYAEAALSAYTCEFCQKK